MRSDQSLRPHTFYTPSEASLYVLVHDCLDTFGTLVLCGSLVAD